MRRHESGLLLPDSDDMRGFGVGPRMSVGLATPRQRTCFDKVRGTRPDKLIAYFPLDESSGLVAYDRSGNGRNGAHTAVTLGQPGIGDRRTTGSYNGTTSYTNIYSAGLASAFSGAEGTLVVWAKVANAGVWTDAAIRYIAGLQVDTNNRLRIVKWSTNNSLTLAYTAGAATKQAAPTLTDVGWFSAGMTWSKSTDQALFYVKGVATGAAQTSLGTWAGALSATSCNLGANVNTPTYPWSGLIGHAAFWSTALTPAEMAYLGVL
jgi:hypothetical protein